MLAVIIVPTLIAVETPAVQTITLNLQSILILLGLGVISAAAMVIPGVSGSMILMMLGYYQFIINTIKTTIEAVLHFDWLAVGTGVGILIPFGIGILLGIILISKIIAKIFKRYPNATYWGIIGLVVASPLAIIINATTTISSPVMLLVCLIAFGIGFVVSNKLGEKS